MIEFWLSEGELDLPESQRNCKRRWLGSILIKDDHSVIHQYEITIDRKIKLNEMLRIVRLNIDPIVSALDFEPADLGFSIC